MRAGVYKPPRPFYYISVRCGPCPYLNPDIFRKEFPHVQLFYFIGADNLPEFHKWHRYQDILRKVRLVVYDRKEGHLPDNLPANRILFLQTPLIEISSTLIRERLKQGRAVRSLLPNGVLTYIKENRLYLK